MTSECARQECLVEVNDRLQFRCDIKRIWVLKNVGSKKPMLTIILSPMERYSVIRRLVRAIPQESRISPKQVLAEFELVEKCVPMKRKMNIPTRICFLLQARKDWRCLQVIPVSQRLLMEKCIPETKFRKTNGNHLQISILRLR